MPSGTLCAVDGCKSSKRRDKHLTFFYLPVNDERRKTWAELIGRPDLARSDTKPKSHFVCCLHFEKSVIIQKLGLRPDALPTKLLPSLPTTSSASTEPESKEISTQTKYSNINILSAITIKGADTKSQSVRRTITYSVPKDPSVKEKWIDATGRFDWMPTKSSTICSIHFRGRIFNYK